MTSCRPNGTRSQMPAHATTPRSHDTVRLLGAKGLFEVRIACVGYDVPSPTPALFRPPTEAPYSAGHVLDAAPTLSQAQGHTRRECKRPRAPEEAPCHRGGRPQPTLTSDEASSVQACEGPCATDETKGTSNHNNNTANGTCDERAAKVYCPSSTDNHPTGDAINHDKNNTLGNSVC